MNCSDCPYYWKEEEEVYPCCHWESRCPGDIAPCEEEENDRYNEEVW